MRQWKLFFALMAVSCLVYCSSAVGPRPDFIDMMVTFEIEDKPARAEGIPYMMDGLLQLLPVGKDKINLCCIWLKGRHRVEYYLRTSASHLQYFTAQIGFFLNEPWKVDGIKCERRNFTHFGEVVVKTVDPGNMGRNEWTEYVGRMAKEEAEKDNFNGLAMIFLNDYNRGQTLIWMVIHFNDRMAQKDYEEKDWKAASTTIYNQVWNAANIIVRECKYWLKRGSCYFPREERDQCVQEERIEPVDKQHWSPPARRFCNSTPDVKTVHCPSTEVCYDYCREIAKNLKEAPCPCGSSNKTAPKPFEHCPLTSVPCPWEPCSSSSSLLPWPALSLPSPSSPSTPSPPLSLGAMLTIAGGAMFLGSGIGLLVFWLACVKRSGTVEGRSRSKSKPTRRR